MVKVDEELYSESEYEALKEWSFLKDYLKARRHFSDLIRKNRDLYRYNNQNRLPDPTTLANLIGIALQGDPVFNKMIKNKVYIKPERVPLFADIFARYILSIELGNTGS